MASAWGRPPGAVAPLPAICPSATMTQPTLGLGAVRPRALSPSATASAIQRAAFDAKLLFQLLELPLPFLLRRFPGRLVLLLIGLDLGVRPVGRPLLDVDDLRRRRGVDLRIDEENDDDDNRHQHGEDGADHLFAAALAEKGPQVTQGDAGPGDWGEDRHSRRG